METIKNKQINKETILKKDFDKATTNPKKALLKFMEKNKDHAYNIKGVLESTGLTYGTAYKFLKELVSENQLQYKEILGKGYYAFKCSPDTGEKR